MLCGALQGATKYKLFVREETIPLSLIPAASGATKWPPQFHKERRVRRREGGHLAARRHGDFADGTASGRSSCAASPAVLSDSSHPQINQRHHTHTHKPVPNTHKRHTNFFRTAPLTYAHITPQGELLAYRDPTPPELEEGGL